MTIYDTPSPPPPMPPSLPPGLDLSSVCTGVFDELPLLSDDPDFAALIMPPQRSEGDLVEAPIMNLQRSEGDLVEAPSTPPTFEDLCRRRSEGGLIENGNTQSLDKARFEIYVALRAAKQGYIPSTLYNEICEKCGYRKVKPGGATTKLNKLVDEIRNQNWHNTIPLPGK